MKSILTVSLILISITLYSQGWIGKSDSLLISYNTTPVLNPIKVGIGTSSPVAQFHTTGSVRLAGITNNNTHSRVMVQNTSGDVFWRDASTLGGSNAWLLTGNAGTNPATNFVGTTDNVDLNFRANNIQRLSISTSNVVGTNNISYILAGQQSMMPTQPVSVGIFGKDISGSMHPLGVSGYVGGMTWSAAGGSNNTVGRLIRLAQWSNTTNYQFYDHGIDDNGNYFISDHGVSTSGGFFPTKKIEITAGGNVGINMTWGSSATANLHSDGTVRFENLPSGSGNILVIDGSGNVYASSQTASRMRGDKEIEDLKKELNSLQQELLALKLALAEIQKANGIKENRSSLLKITPNPSSQTVYINYSLQNAKKVKVAIYNANGAIVRQYANLNSGNHQLSITKNELTAGTYFCTLSADNEILDTQKFVFVN